MKIKSVFSHAFTKYGKILKAYDVTDLLAKLLKKRFTEEQIQEHERLMSDYEKN